MRKLNEKFFGKEHVRQSFSDINTCHRQQEYARSKVEQRDEEAVRKIQEQGERARAGAGLRSHGYSAGDMDEITQVVIDLG